MRIKTTSKQTALEAQPGTLYVVATPIGNLEDITLRAVRILGEVDLIASEDTRHTKKLLSHLGISTKQTSYYKDKEAGKAVKIIRKLQDGFNVALVADAGTPAISDPGHILVREARKAGISTVPVPGPSALTTAVSVAGLADNSFIFLGFLPARKGERCTLLKTFVHEKRALVFYESPRRLSSSLKDCQQILDDRQAFWARELTKIHEELTAEPLSGLIRKLAGRQIKGESVVIISGAAGETPPEGKDIDTLLRWYRDQKELSLKDAVQKLSRDMGLSRAKVYAAALKIWQQAP